MKEKKIAVWTRDRDGDIEVTLYESIEEAIDELVYFRDWLGYGDEILSVETRTGIVLPNLIELYMHTRSKHLKAIVEARREKPGMYTHTVEVQRPADEGEGDWVRMGHTRSYEEAVARSRSYVGVIGAHRVRIINSRTGKVEE